MKLFESIEDIHRIARKAGMDQQAKELNWHSINLIWYHKKKLLSSPECLYHIYKCMKYSTNILTELGEKYKENVPDLKEIYTQFELLKSNAIQQDLDQFRTNEEMATYGN